MKRSLVAMGAVLAMLPAAAWAHHSFAAEYDGTKPMALVGIISKVDQQNPHGFFYMNVTGANGRVTNWALETPGPNQLIQTGFTQQYQAMVDNKEQVTVKAYPARDGSKKGFAETITRADGRTVITISVGGVTGNVGRAAPRDNAITVDGVAQPLPATGGGRGGAAAPRGGQRGGTAPAPGGAAPAPAPGGTRQ